MKITIEKLHAELQRFGAASIGASRTCHALACVPGVITGSTVNLAVLASLNRKALDKKYRGLGDKGLGQLEQILAEHNLTFNNSTDYEDVKITLEGCYLVVRLKLTGSVYQQLADTIKPL